MNRQFESIVGRIHRSLGGNRLATNLAIKLRNQVDAVIAAHLNDGIELSTNGELWLIEQVAPSTKLFVDVGANIGAWSKAILNKTANGPKGIVFEPSPVALDALRSNLRDAIQTGTIDVVASGVSDQIGKMDFFMEPGAGETSSLVSAHSNNAAERISIPITTIDIELRARNVTFIDILKIDVEGYDLHVLRGAHSYLAQHSIGVIQFEYNTPWAYAGSTLKGALDYLMTHGYKVYLLKRDGLHEFPYAKFGEYYRYSNFVALAPKYLNVEVHRL